MSSIKLLKKKVKRMVYEVLDDCDYVIVNGGKKADDADKLIDDAVDFHEQMIQKINNAKNKAEFRSINEELNAKEIEFVKSLNKLS